MWGPLAQCSSPWPALVIEGLSLLGQDIVHTASVFTSFHCCPVTAVRTSLPVCDTQGPGPQLSLKFSLYFQTSMPLSVLFLCPGWPSSFSPRCAWSIKAVPILPPSVAFRDRVVRDGQDLGKLTLFCILGHENLQVHLVHLMPVCSPEQGDGHSRGWAG